VATSRTLSACLMPTFKPRARNATVSLRGKGKDEEQIRSGPRLFLGGCELRSTHSTVCRWPSWLISNVSKTARTRGSMRWSPLRHLPSASTQPAHEPAICAERRTELGGQGELDCPGTTRTRRAPGGHALPPAPRRSRRHLWATSTEKSRRPRLSLAQSRGVPRVAGAPCRRFPRVVLRTSQMGVCSSHERFLRRWKLSS
jgi:hypothetical protein